MHALRSRGQHPLFQPAGVCILGSPLLKASGAIVTRIVQNRSLHSGKMGVAETQILRQLAERIKSLREANGWTQEQFAERAAMQRSYLADLELGRRNPSVRTLVKVANAFGIAVPELFERGKEIRRART